MVHILVVEDDPAVCDVIVAMLEDHGFTAVGVASGAGMREMLAGERPIDAIVLDWLLPGEDGLSLAAHAKTMRLPLIVVSGDLALREDASMAPFHFLAKPFSSADLIRTVTIAIGSASLKL